MTALHSIRQGIPLAIENIEKAFGERQVLKGIDLHIPAGQFVAVVGRSGCGKSTLLRLLAGLDQPSGGQLLAGNGALNAVREDIRLMFQDARLLPWKRVIDNVGLGLSGNWRAQAEEALAAVGLADRAHEWPAALSGGQKQRVALARALIHRPRLLLLDEPLGALDALTRIEMQQPIESLWQQHGFTVLLVTHDVAEAVAIASEPAQGDNDPVKPYWGRNVDNRRCIAHRVSAHRAPSGRALSSGPGQGHRSHAHPPPRPRPPDRAPLPDAA